MMLSDWERLGRWTGRPDQLQSALRGAVKTRMDLALSLADEEYHHPESEAVDARPERRSFCFHHGQSTPRSVLLIHGFTACPFEMRELGERLYQNGYNVFGIRLAGHGTSVADFARYGRNDWKCSAQKGLAIAALMGNETIVIGESMGGGLAGWLGATYPKLVKKLVLCAPCLRIANPWASFAALAPVRLIMPQNDMGVLADWQKDYWYRFIPTQEIAELVRLTREVRDVGPAITAPIQIIQAEDDCIVDYRGALDFFRSIRIPEKQLHLFTPGHHNLTINLNPRKNQVFRWIDDFLI